MKQIDGFNNPEVVAIVQDLIDDLSEEQQTIVKLRCEGKTIEEISDEIGVSPMTTKRRIAEIAEYLQPVAEIVNRDYFGWAGEVVNPWVMMARGEFVQPPDFTDDTYLGGFDGCDFGNAEDGDWE